MNGPLIVTVFVTLDDLLRALAPSVIAPIAAPASAMARCGMAQAISELHKYSYYW